MKPATQLRVAITVSDIEKALSFFRDALGLPVQEEWSSPGRGVVLSIKQATLEILDPEHAAFVDRIEAGRRVSGRIRFAFQVPDLREAMAKAREAGGQLVNGPIETPWKDMNARLLGPEGLQVTLFQSAGPKTS